MSSEALASPRPPPWQLQRWQGACPFHSDTATHPFCKVCGIYPFALSPE